MWEECPWWVVCVLLMVYVVVCYNGKGRCNIQGLPKSPECTHYLALSREQMSVISPVILSDTFAGTFLFKMELSIPLLFIFLNAPPFPSLLFAIHFSFCLTRFFLYTYGQVSLKCISAFLLKINPLPIRPVTSFCTFFWSQIKKKKEKWVISSFTQVLGRLGACQWKGRGGGNKLDWFIVYSLRRTLCRHEIR